MDILKRLEWQRNNYYHSCPICYEAWKYGHAVDCELAKVLIDGGEKDVKIQKPINHDLQ